MRFIILLFLFVTMNSVAQKTEYDSITIARYYDNDTIKVASFVDLSSDVIKLPDLYIYHILYIKNNEKVKMHPRRIKFLEFNDSDNILRRFVSPVEINIFLNERNKINIQQVNLLEEIYIGEFKWYKRYDDFNEISETSRFTDIIIYDSILFEYNRRYMSNFNKKIKKKFSDYPDLISVIDSFSYKEKEKVEIEDKDLFKLMNQLDNLNIENE